MKNVQDFPRAEIKYEYRLMFAINITRLKKVIRFQKRKPKWDL
jgi:hypothetical protein